MGEDVSDGRSFRPWLCTANRPAGRQARRSIIPRLPDPCIPPFLIGKLIIGRISNKGWALEGAWRTFPIWKGDPRLILLKGKVGLWGLRSRPSPGSAFIYTKISARPRSGFYLHKECRAAEIWISSPQSFGPGCDPDFIDTEFCVGAILK